MGANKEFQEIYKVAIFVAISCVLQICESLIPHPIPGLRLGLANIMTLLALVTLGFRPALEVAIFRTLLSSFIMGTFMSPAFILSFSGALISTLIMGFLYWLVQIQKHYRLSIVGISIVGALSHNLVQLYLAYLILVKHKGIFVFLPWLCIGAVVMGWLTGVVAGNVCRRLKEMQGQKAVMDRFPINYSALKLQHYLSGSSLLHRLSSEIKIISLIILSLAVLISNNLWFYLGLFVCLVAVIIISQTSISFVLSGARRYASLVFASVLFPLFFNSGKHVLSNIFYFKITSEGLSLGVIFAFRIVLLMLASSLLARTTSPEELSRGLARILSPLRHLGIPDKRIATILSLSWMALPVFWETARNFIGGIDFKKVKNLCNLIPLLGDLIATLYLMAEQVTAHLEDTYSSG